jgi:hypothetical protein
MNNKPFILQIDAEALASTFKEIKVEVEQALTDGVKLASAIAFSKANELANEKLHSTRKTFQENLSYKELAPGVWSIELDEKAMWIEENVDAHSMVNDLLRKNAKINKKGQKYKVIPFDHSKPSSEQTTKAKEFSEMIKSELKARQIPLKKIEKNSDGSPKLGKLHSFNIQSPKPTKMAQYPVLSGLSIYQSKDKKGKVRRDVLTFRVVTSEHQNRGLWWYPGKKGAYILDETFSFIERTFNDQILPEILKKYESQSNL